MTGPTAYDVNSLTFDVELPTSFPYCLAYLPVSILRHHKEIGYAAFF